ncbi:MAG: hypothetical protein WBW88_20695 [Rhodothermales bacterium]
MEYVFWILILLAPALSRILRARKKKQMEQQQRPPAPRQALPQRASTERQPTPFEEALRQIQEALTESQRPAPREPEPVRREPTRLEPVRRDVARPKPRPMAPEPRPSEFHAPTQAAGKPHFFDEPFDLEAIYSAPGRDKHYHAPLSDTDDKQVIVGKRRQKVLSKWQRAVANIEILSSPRTTRPWSSPWGE